MKLPNAAGLDPATCYPPLVRAQSAAVDAERMLEQRRADLAEIERTMVGLPARIQRGELRASVLADSMRQRDTAALLIAPIETALVKAKECVAVEELAARRALEREVHRRLTELEKAAVEPSRMLEEIAARAAAIVAALQNGAFSTIDWACSPACQASRRAAQMASAPAVPSLMWSPATKT